MFRLVLVKTKTLLLCLLLVWLQSSSALRLKSGKPSMYMKKHKGYHRSHVSDSQASSQASRRSTYRINMPMRVAKLLLPQIGNKNQETIIRIYPDKTAEQNQQNQNGSNYVLSLSYKKLNEEGPNNAVFKDPCPQGGCCCCSGMNIDPMSICRPGCPICPTPCVCCCCSPPPPPPPPPPPKKPPPPTCPMVCLPCCPCPRPPCPCRPHCIRRPILRPCYPPCRIPAPPLTGPIPGPCVPAPPVMGPCHPPCLPRLPPIRPLPQLQRFAPNPLAAAPPISPNRPIVVDHPLRGPAIFIDQCRDFIAECKDYAKRGMCNHPSPFHTIQQIRKICPFSCGICKDYDENAALLRRHTQKQSTHVRPALRAKLNIALAQIIRNKALEGHSTIEPEQEKPVSKDEQTGEKKSHDTIASESQPHNSQVLPGGEEDFSGSGRSGYITNEIT